VAKPYSFPRSLCENNPNKLNQMIWEMHQESTEVCCAGKSHKEPRVFKVNQKIMENKVGVCLECGHLLCMFCMSAHAPCFGFMGEKGLRDPARQARGRG